MSQEAVERILGRMITDRRFLCQAIESLQTASMQEGYPLSQIELRLLSGLGQDCITEFAGHLDPGLCRADGTRG